jgi:hypothetical protein
MGSCRAYEFGAPFGKTVQAGSRHQSRRQVPNEFRPEQPNRLFRNDVQTAIRANQRDRIWPCR